MSVLPKIMLVLAAVLIWFPGEAATVFWLENKGTKKALAYWQARDPVKAGLLILQQDTSFEGNLCLKNLAGQFPVRDVSVIYYPLSAAADKATWQADITLLLNRMQEIFKTPNLYILYYGRGVENIAPVLQEHNKRYQAHLQTSSPTAAVQPLPAQANSAPPAQVTQPPGQGQDTSNTLPKEALIRGIIYLSALDTSPPEPKSLGLHDLKIPLLDVGTQFDFTTVRQQIAARHDLYLNNHTYRKLDVLGVGHDYCYQGDSLASYISGWMLTVKHYLKPSLPGDVL